MRNDIVGQAREIRARMDKRNEILNELKTAADELGSNPKLAELLSFFKTALELLKEATETKIDTEV